MRHDEALMDILQDAQRLARDLPKTVWYGFGSYFNGQKSFGDIDILVVSPTTVDAVLVRAKMEEICVRWPIHLVIMTEDEQGETNFVASERCVVLHPARAKI